RAAVVLPQGAGCEVTRPICGPCADGNVRRRRCTLVERREINDARAAPGRIREWPSNLLQHLSAEEVVQGLVIAAENQGVRGAHGIKHGAYRACVAGGRERQRAPAVRREGVGAAAVDGFRGGWPRGVRRVIVEQAVRVVIERASAECAARKLEYPGRREFPAARAAAIAPGVILGRRDAEGVVAVG